VALDIGTYDPAHRQVEPVAAFEDFDSFFEASVDTLATALDLACNDDELAADSLAGALTAAAQRWRRVQRHPNPTGWTLARALDTADEVLRARSGTGEAGGYNRGLELHAAIEQLPLTQRAALVTTYHLDWSDRHTAEGFGSTVDVIETRRKRALSFLAHHVGLPVDEIEEGVTAYLADRASRITPELPDRFVIRRRARLRTVRNRVSVTFVVAAIIALGAAVVSVDEPSPPEPEIVSGPTVSSEWLGPVSDGTGGFVALNRSGASRFVWYEAATWNSRAIDLRTAVTRFVRSGDRYLASVELRPEFTQTLAPFIARSTSLRDWRVDQLDMAEPVEVEGLQNRFEVLAMASSGDTVLATVRLDRRADLRSLGIRGSDVCVETTTVAATVLTLCDGSAVRVERPQDTSDTMFFVSEAGAPFEQLDVAPFVGRREIVGFSGGFLAADPVSGTVSISVDGRDWAEVDSGDLGGADRFVLIEGSRSEEALVVRPSPSGWTSSLVAAADDTQATTRLPIDLDPASVWTAPDTAVGPAGWAIYVTTSRPWERGEATPGWAVDTGDWIVTRVPDSQVITAESADGAIVHRFAAGGALVEVTGGDVELTVPPVPPVPPTPAGAAPDTSAGGGETVRITITAEQIERSRAIDDSSATAWVLFSENGDEWRVVWESTDANWLGSVSVGDDELLIHGASLTGGPITVPVGDGR